MMNLSPSRFLKLSVCALFFHLVAFGASADMGIDVTSQTDSSAFVDGQFYNFVSPAESYNYDIHLANLAPFVANNVTVTMIIPEETEFVQSTYEPMISSGNNLIWSFGDLEGNFDYNWVVNVKVKRDVDASVTTLNCVITVNTPNDSVAINNTDSDIIMYQHKQLAPLHYDLAVDLDYSADHDTVITRNGQNYYAVFMDEPFQYNIRVQNNSNLDAENITLAQVIPAGVNYTSSQPAAVLSGNTLTWDVPLLGAHSSTSFTVNAVGDFETEQSASSAVQVIAEKDTFYTNNTDTESLWFIQKQTQAESYDLVLTLDALSDTSLTINGYDYPGFDEKIGFKYHIHLLNNGTAKATDIHVDLDVPDELKVNKTTHSPIQNVQNTLTWNIAELSAGAEWDEVVEVDPVQKFPYYPFQLSASSSVQADDDSNTGNNQDNINIFAIENETVVGDYADLKMNVLVETDSVFLGSDEPQYFIKAGETVTLRIDVENIGNQNATDIRLVTGFDSRLTGSNYLPNPNTVSSSSLSWTMNNIQPAAKQSFRIDLTAPEQFAVGLNTLMINTEVECSNEPISVLDNNAVEQALYNRTVQLEDFTPEIRLSQAMADVSDSVLVSVFFPVEISEWSLTVALPNGQLLQDFAQTFINTQTITPNTWVEIDEPYIHHELFSGSPEDKVSFQVQAIGRGGNSGYAETTLTVNSTNDLRIGRNVFKPQEEGTLDINFKMIADAHVICQVYDTAGHKVVTLADDFYTGGWTTLIWDGKDIDGLDTGSGVYLVTLSTDHSNLYKKVIIVR